MTSGKRDVFWPSIATLLIAAGALTDLGCTSASGRAGKPQESHAPPASSGAATVSGSAARVATVSTDPGLKVAFIGDTGTGAGYQAVLDLIKREGAQALVVEGDMSYDDDP